MKSLDLEQMEMIEAGELGCWKTGTALLLSAAGTILAIPSGVGFAIGFATLLIAANDHANCMADNNL